MLTILSLFLLQKPFGTQNPDDNGPVDFSNPFDVIVFIILPILIVVFYFIWRRNKRHDREE